MTSQASSERVTAPEIKSAVEKACITRIHHHDCSLCGYPVAYQIVEGELYFDPGCHCVSTPRPPEPCDWADAAAWINMQQDPNVQREVASRFGLELVP